MENNKNIWLLPTNEPSRLYFDVATKELMLQKKLSFNATSFPIEKRNIYITNDETIKEGDWFLDDDRLSKFSNNGKPIWVLRQCTHIRNGWIFYDEKESEGCNPIWSKKIILTDNQDLINDGVQPIPDEFLEWFVKNPSCESVDVDYRYDTNLQPILDSFGNKVLRIKIPTESENLSQIIIPKEEPLYDYGWCKGNVILPKEEPKQSTKERIISETSEETKQKARDYGNSLVNKKETLEEYNKKSFGEIFIKLTNEQSEYLKDYINSQR